MTARITLFTTLFIHKTGYSTRWAHIATQLVKMQSLVPPPVLLALRSRTRQGRRIKRGWLLDSPLRGINYLNFFFFCLAVWFHPTVTVSIFENLRIGAFRTHVLT